MNKEEHISIYSGSAITILGLATLLEQHRIATIVKDHTESGRLAGFGTQYNDVELYVLKSDKLKALELIKQFESEA
jgi:hypothetical protein